MSRPRQPSAPDPAGLEWFWLGVDRRGRVARFDAWPATARARPAGRFPTSVGYRQRYEHETAAFVSTLLARKILSLPRAYTRPVRLLSLARAQSEAVTDGEALPVRDPAGGDDRSGQREGIALVELRAAFEELPLAVLLDIAEQSSRLANPLATSDSPRHAWLWTTPEFLQAFWRPLGVERAWLKLDIPPAELGAFEYVFDAEVDAYRCVATPVATVMTLDDLPRRLVHEFLGLDTEFGLARSFAATDKREFIDLPDFLPTNPRRRRS